jgi:hypothetical protein
VRDPALTRAVATAASRGGGARAHQIVCAGALARWFRARDAGPPAGALSYLGVSMKAAASAASDLAPIASIVEGPDGPGIVRQALVEGSKEQSQSGLFYTPWRVALAMADLVRREAPSGKVMDPAAGSGVFGLALVDRGSDLWLVEKDPLGACIAASCLFVESRRRGFGLPGVWRADALADAPAEDVMAQVARVGIRAIEPQSSFVAAIGNPPYGHVSGLPEGNEFGRPANLAAVFTLRYLMRLAPGGVLAFLLPRSLEFVESWTEFRRALFERSEPIGVCPLGREIDVGMEQTMVAVRRAEKPVAAELRVLRLGAGEFTPDYQVPRRECSNPRRLIAWCLSPECRRVLHKIEARSKPLAALRLRICRGLTVQRHLVSAERGRNWITRSEIERFRITGSRYLSADAPPALERRAKRLRGAKIVAQRRVSRRAGPPARIVLKAAYDPDGRFDPADTVVNVFLDDRESALLALSVLNTELASYYLLARAFNGNAQTTPDLDRAYLERLFIPELPRDDQRAVVRLAERATEASLAGETPEDPSAEIDDRLAVFFGLTRADRAVMAGG